MPTEQPIKMPGKKRPAGTQTPYVMIVRVYQTTKKIVISPTGTELSLGLLLSYFGKASN